MRDIGYPPGYLGNKFEHIVVIRLMCAFCLSTSRLLVCMLVFLVCPHWAFNLISDADIEDQPSGITIFGDEPYKDESEEGEILDASYAEASRKKTVKFPGLNAPIPENADERLWTPSSASFTPSRYSSHQRYNQPTENSSRGYRSEQRWSRDWDDEGPPGSEPGTSPSLSNHFHRYGDVDSGYHPLSPRDSPSTPWSSSYGRSWSDRGRRSPRIHDSSPYYGNYTSPR